MSDTSGLSLYHYDSCPFCMRVRQVIQHLGLEIELRNIQTDPDHRSALLEGGGKTTVPCLRIESPGGDVRWMYESSDIADYLRANYAP